MPCLIERWVERALPDVHVGERIKVELRLVVVTAVRLGLLEELLGVQLAVGLGRELKVKGRCVAQKVGALASSGRVHVPSLELRAHASCGTSTSGRATSVERARQRMSE